MTTLLCLLLIFLLIPLAICREQSVIIVGQLICNKKYLLDAEVEAWERDLCEFISNLLYSLWCKYALFLVDPDDFLNKTENPVGGYFVLTATENEFFSITPYIKIKHRCDVADERVSQFNSITTS